MRRARCVAVLVLTAVLSMGADAQLSPSHKASGASASDGAPGVSLLALSGATIEFRTENGQARGVVPSRSDDIPHLVLTRNGALTPPAERTLQIEVSGLLAPAGGLTLTLEVATERVDPDDRSNPLTILVWSEARHVAGEAGATVRFTRTFTEAVFVGGQEVPTPTDYFGYTITLGGAAGVLQTLSGDRAFLIENQVVAQLPKVREESEGAAPDELVIAYCDMVPFQGGRDAVRLARNEVPGFVETDLAPRMVEAFRTQGNDWGFAWHGVWTSFNPEAAHGMLPVALTDRDTWYHGKAPLMGLASVSINVHYEGTSHYDSLADAIMSTFHHELFHNLQRSLDQHLGGDGAVDGLGQAWTWFSEGTAELASSVGQPAVEFAQQGRGRYYLRNADRFLLLHLANRETMVGNAAVLYWRFLYEQCGGMSDGIEDPAAGMQVVREALSTLYAGDIVDIETSSDVVRAIPHVMDQALAHAASCPFVTYEESLNHFARDVYALTLDGGRCQAPGGPEGCGFYDPQGLYLIEPPQTIHYSGTERMHSSVIHSSYGMSFLELILDPTADGQPLAIEVEGAADSRAEFSVQVWRLVDGELGSRHSAIPEHLEGPELIGAVNPGGKLVYTIPTIDATRFSRLGIIIVRTDPNEGRDLVGAYTVRFLPAGAGSL